MKIIQKKDLTFISNSEAELSNFKETYRLFPNEFILFEELLELYKNLNSSFLKKPTDNLVPIIQMDFICFRGFLISTQLMGQGHFSEAYSIISRSSEAVGYAVVMNIDKEKGKIWIEKSGTKEFHDLFGEPFPKGEKLLHPTIFSIYKITRRYGSHTNFDSIIHSFTKNEDRKFTMIYCDFNDIKWMKRNLMFIVHSYVEFLLVFCNLFSNFLDKTYSKQVEKFNVLWITYKLNNSELFKN
jgi:hypothetical protein